MKETINDSWLRFHFGSAFVDKQTNMPVFSGKYEDCYVLFADFGNFTKFFSASNNISLIEPLISNYYIKSRKIIHKYGGMLDKILGDGFLIVWGIHNNINDVEESSILNCITELLEESLFLAKKWQEIIDISIDNKGMSFGLSKGEVVAIQRNDVYPGISILGDSINLSSRLQSMATSNQLIYSNRCHKFFENLNINSKISTLDVKGIGLVLSHIVDL